MTQSIITYSWWLVVFALVFMNACSPTITKPESNKNDENDDKPRLVGIIASIHEKENFVLIQSYGSWKIETGAILTTLGPDGRAANLKVTGEKTGQFAAADIQSGSLEIGDSVYTTISYREPNNGGQLLEMEANQPSNMTDALPNPN